MRLAAVDWGTSHMRLWLLDGAGAVLAERRSDDGVLRAAEKGFARILDDHLAALGAPNDLPVLICGMAGSRQGWRETSYLDTPASLTDVAANAVAVADAGRDVRILPGIAQQDPAAAEVMRGEETQLIGALGLGSDTLACLPGSHSKWAHIEKGVVTGFATFMTGELFSAISRHTILSQAMEEGRSDIAASAAFTDAVRAMLEQPASFSRGLFAIRAGQILGYGEKRDGTARLSGLLIGLEIAGVRDFRPTAGRVTLIASPPLVAPYRAALEMVGIEVELRDAETAVRHGLALAAAIIWPELAAMGERP